MSTVIEFLCCFLTPPPKLVGLITINEHMFNVFSMLLILHYTKIFNSFEKKLLSIFKTQELFQQELRVHTNNSLKASSQALRSL